MACLADMDTTSLVEAIRRQDTDAFSELVRRFQGPLSAHVRARIRNYPESIQDIVQDVWLELMPKIRLPVEEGGFDPGKASFYTYLVQCVAKFVILKWYRKLNTPETSLYPDHNGEEEPLDIPDKTGSTPSDILDRKERYKLLLRAYQEMFRIVFLCGGYPYQLLSFGFSKLIFGKISDRGVEGTSETVHSKYGHLPLEKLLKQFWAAFKQVSELDDKALGGYLPLLNPIAARNALVVKEMYNRDHTSLKTYKLLQERLVAGTSLSDYYTSSKNGHTSAIPSWCYKVESRLRSILGIDLERVSSMGFNKTIEEEKERFAAGIDVSESCSHCKLRGIPPCSGRMNALKPVGDQVKALKPVSDQLKLSYP